MSNYARKLLPVFGLAIALLTVESALAQGGRGGRGNFNLFRGGNTNIFLLMSDAVQEELDLTDDQMEDLRALQEESQQTMRDMFSGMRNMPREEREAEMERLRDEMQTRTREMETRVEEILLPHQVNRLKQIGYQSSGRNRGAGGALSNDQLLDELGVSGEQRAELEEAMEKAREELQEKYQKLVKEAENDILKVLTEEQRKRYRELVGDPFQFDNNRFRGAQRGGRGEERGRDRGNDF